VFVQRHRTASLILFFFMNVREAIVCFKAASLKIALFEYRPIFSLEDCFRM